MDSSSVEVLSSSRCEIGCSGGVAQIASTLEWEPSQDSQHDARDFQSRYAMGMARPESHQPRSTEREAVAHPGCTEYRPDSGAAHASPGARAHNGAGGCIDRVANRRTPRLAVAGHRFRELRDFS